VLILPFFHGFYPDEMAPQRSVRLVRSSLSAARLRWMVKIEDSVRSLCPKNAGSLSTWSSFTPNRHSTN
jgi:hypothetical protein